MTRSAALRKAKISLIKNPSTSHPFYWAAFELIGDGK
ncbi:MAG: CHAT domain-containing protein [Firmicutes bacterium]|nr:CHAT domain-containing protein [Bacillota bacterium]